MLDDVSRRSGERPVRSAERAARRRGALALGLGLALYGNAWSIVDGATQLSLGGTIGGGLLGVGALRMASRSGRAGLEAIGLGRRGLGRSLLVGLLLGLLMGLPGVLYAIAPSLAPIEVRYEPLKASGQSTFLLLVLVKIPLATALAEELAFRGILQARLRETFGAPAAVLIGSLVFTAWHLVVSFTTLQATNLAADPLLTTSAYLVQNLAVFGAGLVWCWLREWSGNLAGCVASHWLVDVLLVSGMYVAGGR
jgi:tRNA pseudouridine32 synthase/23S rRNA pseudouridine746 synthase